MNEQFDPYYTWLGIPPEEQPPNCYRLLGLRPFETNPQVIENGANRQMSHLRTFQVGPQSASSQKLLNEVAAAKICLLNPAKKAEYDRRLREAMEGPEEAMPDVSADTPRARKSRIPAVAIVATLALLTLLGAGLYGIYISGSGAEQSPKQTVQVPPPPEKPTTKPPKEPTPKNGESPPKQPGPVSPPEEPPPGEPPGTKEPDPKEPGPEEPVPPTEPPKEETPKPLAPPEEPPPSSVADPAELLDANRWFRVNRPEPGVLARLDSDAATMSVNPVYALLAVAGDLAKPGPVRFIGVGTKEDGKNKPGIKEAGPEELARRASDLETTDRATCVAFGPSGQRLAVGNAEGEIRVWNLRAGKEECRFESGNPIRVLAFNRHERILASIDAEGKTVRLWSLTDRAALRSIELSDAAAQSLVFFPRGDSTAVGLRNGNVLVFDAYDDAKRTSSATNRGAVGALAAGRGNMILAGTADGSTTVFAPKPRFVLGPFEPDEKPVASLAMHERSGLLAVCGGDATIRLWQCVEGRVWARLEGHTGPVTAVGFSQDGNQIFSLAGDKTVRVWNTPPVPDAALAERIKPLDPDAPALQALLPVPDEATRTALREELLASYALRESRTLPEKQKLARTILQAARAASGKPNDYFVLLAAAAEEARDSGNVEILTEALDRLSATFEYDADRKRIDMLAGCAGKVHQREQAAFFVTTVENLALELLLNESRHGEAKKLSTAMSALCQKPFAKEFRTRARTLREKVENLVDRKKLLLPKRRTIAEWRDPRYRPGLLKKYGGTVESERAVEAALKWLADVQFPDGGWSFDHGLHPGRNGKATDTGHRRDARNTATATALLPFLAAGNTHREGKYKKTVAAGLDFLGKRIKAEKHRRRPVGGSLWSGEEALWAHPLGGLVFSEAFVMTGDKRLKPFIEQLARYSFASQDSTGGGWYAYPAQREGEIYLTLKQVQFLFVAGLLSKDAVRGTSRFLNSCEYDGGARYHSQKGNNTQSLRDDASGLYLRLLLGTKLDDPGFKKGIDRLKEENEWRLNDVESSLLLSELLFQADADGWQKWNSVYRDKVVREQEREGVEEGSWYYQGYYFGREGGRLYCTATVALILETYYRYPRLHEE